jgi:hypothetical protein
MHDTVVQRSIAEAVGLGVYYFSDDFKQVTGRRTDLLGREGRAFGTPTRTGWDSDSIEHLPRTRWDDRNGLRHLLRSRIVTL